MQGRYIKPGLLLLLLWVCAPLQAMELQRLTPTVTRPGSEIHLQGQGFGSSAGDLSVVIQERGEATRVRMPVVSWSDRDILVRVPGVISPGVYEISIVSPPSRNPPIQSVRHPLSVLPAPKGKSATLPLNSDWRHPDLHPHPKWVPGHEPGRPQSTPSVLRPDGKSLKASPIGKRQTESATAGPGGGQGFELDRERSGSAFARVGETANGRICADPALVRMEVLSVRRNLDGSYRFRLRLQIRNLGQAALETGAGQTRLTVRQGAGILHTGYWPGAHSGSILLAPGHALDAEVPIAAMTARQAARGLLAELAVVDEGDDGSGQGDCDPANNRLGLDGAGLQRSLGILR